jgi:hypothetical protein
MHFKRYLCMPAGAIVMLFAFANSGEKKFWVAAMAIITA